MNISESNYKIVFTNDSINEMDSIYKYISNKFYAINSAKRLMNKVQEEIQSLKHMPQRNMIIKRIPKIELEYRRLIIKNFVVIYTISEKEKIVQIVHMFYGKSNYLNAL